MDFQKYNNYAWATLLTTKDYLPAILGLDASLKRVNSQYDLIVLVLDTVYADVFEVLNTKQIKYHIIPDYFDTKNIHDQELINYKFQIYMLYKFFIYDLTQYNKIMYVDGDFLFFKNCDFLFNFATPCADRLEFFYSGEMFLIDPSSLKLDFIFNHILSVDHDECLLQRFYRENDFCKLPLNMLFLNNYCQHFHAHGYDKNIDNHNFIGPYWHKFNIDLNRNNIEEWDEKFEQFIQEYYGGFYV